MTLQLPLFLAFQAYFVSETKHSTLVRVSRVSFLKSLVQEGRKVFRSVFCKPETLEFFLLSMSVLQHCRLVADRQKGNYVSAWVWLMKTVM